MLLIGYYFSLPQELFKEPTATIVESREGKLLGAHIASDGQWRFPSSDHIPERFEQCILHFEDAYFYKHPGFNPVAIGKAFIQNIKAGSVVRGGSTLTQQVIRLSRKGQKRSYFEKCIEIILATRLEFKYSKKEILNLYCANAPFGGNVVGLEMAAYRYYGRKPAELSWAENATLAVLPNAPSLIYPGKNQKRLLKKRNRLLLKLYNKQIIDKLTYELAIQEDLPQKPYNLPNLAPHLTAKATKEHNGKRVQTSINFNLQHQVNQIVKQHYNQLQQNHIFNAAVLVMDIETRKIEAYVGNTPTTAEHQNNVDIITANRSTGSIIKPLLYATMLDKGELLPNELVPDIPTNINGYQPENYNESYQGAVPASQALARSLNIPAVKLLQNYGLHRFRDELDYYQIKGIKSTADHYGLSLILGGAEASLWDLCKVYAYMGGTLNHYIANESQYFTNELQSPSYLKTKTSNFGKLKFDKNALGAGSIWSTFEALKKVNRPEGDEAWQFYDSSKKIAWKTGTSFGNRDAWAIGLSTNKVVGVWVGNADGEGRPELTGIKSAAPILFDVFNLIDTPNWFSTPYDDLSEVNICKKSGKIATDICPIKESFVPNLGKNASACTHHKLIHLNQNETHSVNANCYPTHQIVTKSWFTLPPVEAFYYKKNHSDYKATPPLLKECTSEASQSMQFIYPNSNASIYLPKDFNEKQNEVILKIAHQKSDTSLFWYVNDTYLGSTQKFHEIPLLIEPGNYTILAVDEAGNSISRKLEVKE